MEGGDRNGDDDLERALSSHESFYVKKKDNHVSNSPKAR